MKYPFPIKCHSGLKPRITQYFGNTSNNAWYKANGITAPAHNAVDFVLGTPVQTYGTAFVCPFPEAQISKVWWSGPMSTKGNGVQIVYQNYQVLIWHCSEIVVTSGKVKFGETIAYLGNSGLCNPAPTYTQPFSGTHGHLGVTQSGIEIDPLTIFDIKSLIVGEDSGMDKDFPPLFWVLDWIKSQINKLTRPK